MKKLILVFVLLFPITALASLDRGTIKTTSLADNAVNVSGSQASDGAHHITADATEHIEWTVDVTRYKQAFVFYPNSLTGTILIGSFHINGLKQIEGTDYQTDSITGAVILSETPTATVGDVWDIVLDTDGLTKGTPKTSSLEDNAVSLGAGGMGSDGIFHVIIAGDDIVEIDTNRTRYGFGLMVYGISAGSEVTGGTLKIDTVTQTAGVDYAGTQVGEAFLISQFDLVAGENLEFTATVVQPPSLDDLTLTFEPVFPPLSPVGQKIGGF